MQMSELLQLTGLSEKAVRLYEDKGLIRPERATNGRRQFSGEDLARLTFLGQARRLGFPLSDCIKLLELSQDENRRSAEVKAIARQFLEDLELKRLELEAVTEVLSSLVETCPGDENPDCSIINALARNPGIADVG